MVNDIIAKIQAFAADKDGATAIEYGLIAGGISLAIVAGVFAFGDSLGTLFSDLGTAMDSASDVVTTDSAAIQ